MSNIQQLTTNLSNRILTQSQQKNTKGRGRGIHSNGTPGKNGKGKANGFSTAMSNFEGRDKCPPPFEVDSQIDMNDVIFL